MAATSKTPVGRDAVMEALLESAARLFSERRLGSVSVREIAADAGVNHALVFRHFGTKAGLMRAVLADLRERFAEAARRGGPRSSVAESIRLYALILARVLLEGDEAPGWGEEHPVVDWIRELAGAARLTDERFRELAATVLALELGFELYRPAILDAAGIPARDYDDVRQDATLTVIDALTTRWHG